MDCEDGENSGRIRQRRFRYRTAALFGRWRGSRADAALDAVRAGQAQMCDVEPLGIRWRVRGAIEEEHGSRPVRCAACGAGTKHRLARISLGSGAGSEQQGPVGQFLEPKSEGRLEATGEASGIAGAEGAGNAQPPD